MSAWSSDDPPPGHRHLMVPSHSRRDEEGLGVSSTRTLISFKKAPLSLSNHSRGHHLLIPFSSWWMEFQCINSREYYKHSGHSTRDWHFLAKAPKWSKQGLHHSNSHCLSSSIFSLPLSPCPEAPGLERDNSWPKRPSAGPSISILLIS